jgi:hypothetical protein
MAANPNTDFTAGQILTADQQNRFPRGVMGYAIGSANSSFTTTADITGMSITFTAVASRLYKATFSCTMDRNAAGNISVFFTDGSNNVQAQYQSGSASAILEVITFSNLFTVSAGSVTRKIRASTSAGAATVLYTAGSYNYGFIIEDMGPA